MISRSVRSSRNCVVLPIYQQGRTTQMTHRRYHLNAKITNPGTGISFIPNSRQRLRAAACLSAASSITRAGRPDCERFMESDRAIRLHAQHEAEEKGCHATPQ